MDFFPAGETHPIRLEFLGDIVESIRQDDASMQRSIGTLDRATVWPLRELFEPPGGQDPEARDRSATFLDVASSATTPRVFVCEPQDVRAQTEKALGQIESSFAEATARGDRVPAPLDLTVAWSDLEGWIAQATTLEELAVEDGGAAGLESGPSTGPER